MGFRNWYLGGMVLRIRVEKRIGKYKVCLGDIEFKMLYEFVCLYRGGVGEIIGKIV